MTVIDIATSLCKGGVLCNQFELSMAWFGEEMREIWAYCCRGTRRRTCEYLHNTWMVPCAVWWELLVHICDYFHIRTTEEWVRFARDMLLLSSRRRRAGIFINTQWIPWVSYVNSLPYVSILCSPKLRLKFPPKVAISICAPHTPYSSNKALAPLMPNGFLGSLI